jgi:hypothetical protein
MTIVGFHEKTVNILISQAAFGFSTRSLTIFLTGSEGAHGCETSRLAHSLDSRLKDGGAVVILCSQELPVLISNCG